MERLTTDNICHDIMENTGNNFQTEDRKGRAFFKRYLTQTDRLGAGAVSKKIERT